MLQVCNEKSDFLEPVASAVIQILACCHCCVTFFSYLRLEENSKKQKLCEYFGLLDEIHNFAE
jgi:hypothetical protein